MAVAQRALTSFATGIISRVEEVESDRSNTSALNFEGRFDPKNGSIRGKQTTRISWKMIIFPIGQKNTKIHRL